MSRLWLLLLGGLVLALPTPVLHATPVRIVQTGGRFQLLRDGQPYFIRGAGGDERYWDRLARLGGNSVRVWGDERLGEQLDAAQKLGLTLTAGIWLPQIRQGFDYTDTAAIARLREQVRATVTRYRDHPALLVWALGNEMEDPAGANLAVWRTVNDLATLVKELDPNHPVMTVVAEIGGEKLANFQRLCPAVDLLGVNSYGGAPTLGDRYRRQGGTKPYVLTEFGPPGIWETSRDALGAFHEPTSTQKAEIYHRAYTGAVLGSPDLCLGSYAFLWGQKQEATATWFSLFLPDGTRLGPVDTLTELWTGRPPANLCPAIQKLALTDAPTAPVAPGTTVRATLAAIDPEHHGPLRVAWTLQRDPEQPGTGGDAEPVPPFFPEAILHADATGATVRLPAEPGLYRLFATVRDDHAGAAVANVPVRVAGPVTRAKGRPARLPLVLLGETSDGPAPYSPSGWMGDVTAIRLDPASPERPHSGPTCLRCEFQATAGWAGVAWQNPPNDWGDLPGGLDLTGAKRLVFWARGERGGETVNFRFGGIPPQRPFPDSANGSLDGVKLTREWRRYELPVAAGLDLSRVKTGFSWSLPSPGAPVVFYLDDIRWE